jgi:hypothetical protein
MQLVEVSEYHTDVIQRIRALRMARQLRHLPWRKIRKNTGSQRTTFGAQPGDFFGQTDFSIVGNEFQFINLGFEFGNRLLELQKVHGHNSSTAVKQGRDNSEEWQISPEFADRLVN